MDARITKIGFGGACHWCTEAVFQALHGVLKVEQGWIASVEGQSDFSEAVIVHYNQEDISLITLIEIHLRTHRSSSNHSMRKKYRSAVYTFSSPQNEKAKTLISTFQPQFENKLITEVFPFESFRPSPDAIQNYYHKNPKKPFCTKYIDPKLKVLSDQFQDQMKHIVNIEI